MKPPLGNAGKPPLGLRPSFIWNVSVKINRIREIEEAIKRYNEADFPVPYAWEAELRKLKEEMDNGNERTRPYGNAADDGARGWNATGRNGHRATFYDGGANGWF